jgi:plasmid stabilization system protein ParE
MTQPAWTPEDTTLLIRTAVMSGIAVALSKTDSNRATLNELAAIAPHFLDIARKSSNPLLQVLAGENEAVEMRTMTEQFTTNPATLKLQDIRPFALRRCDELAEILAAKATPEQAGEVKQAIIDTCQRVAEETKTGAFLGMGGVRVSPEETALIAEVRRALKAA